MARVLSNTHFPAAIWVIAVGCGLAGVEAQAEETKGAFRFEEHPVEFHNHGVKLAGSLLAPIRDVTVPAVVLVHGAGPQDREPYRELGEHFARQGIAALIYDKRGTGQSGGAYESHAPYENLVNDALAAVACLKERREIEKSQIGIWGLSQGAAISAAAASRSKDIQFVIVVGASVADGTLFYYRDNLFRRFELSGTLRDIAEKGQLLQDTLPHNLRGEPLLSSFAPRSYPPPDQYVDPAWSHVQQPVLAMWGELDQHVPPGESVAGLKHSLAQASNENWTIIVQPRTNHDLKISATGALHTRSEGYPPEALQAMTDWARSALERPAEMASKQQAGAAAPEAGVLPRLASYQRLRWYGHAVVQAALWMLFFTSFLANLIVGLGGGWASDQALNFKRALATFNFLILIGLGVVIWCALDQLHPSCPAVLTYLPLAGSIAALATVAMLIMLARTPRDPGWTPARHLRLWLEVLCLVLFLPYLYYWNAIGFSF